MLRQAVAVALCGLILAACSGSDGGRPGKDATPPVTQATPAPASVSAEEAARRIVNVFGERLKSVSTLAPWEALRRNLKAQYANLITAELLQAWLDDPRSAPGRTVSSPWPEDIIIERVRCAAAGRCEVSGHIRYITSNEVEHGGVFAVRPIQIELRRTTAAGWRIAAVQMGTRTAPRPD